MKTKVTGLIALMIFATLAVSAQRPDRFNKMEGDTPAPKFQQMHAKNMGQNNFFTEEQKVEMKAIRLKSAKEAKPLKDELRELEAHHTTLATAENADLNSIYASIDKIAEVKAGLAKIKAKAHLEIRSTLTEEQLLKFDARKDSMEKKHH